MKGFGFVGSVLSSPVGATTLITTGALSNGGNTGAWCMVKALVTSSIAAIVNLETLDGGGGVVNTIRMYASALDVRESDSGQISFFIPNGYEVRLRTPGTVLGSIQGSLFIAPEVTD